MILLTGGAFQGALECARNLYDSDEKEIHVIDGRSEGIPEDSQMHTLIWDHFTDWYKQQLAAGRSPQEIQAQVDQVLQKIPDIWIITTELGCGLVPMEAFDRLYREEHGRLCCHMAEQAEYVYRISCGIAQCIKRPSERNKGVEQE